MNSKQIKRLLAQGFLPMSVNYCFCLELTLLDEIITNFHDVLQRARNELRFLDLNCSSLKINESTMMAID